MSSYRVKIIFDLGFSPTNSYGERGEARESELPRNRREGVEIYFSYNPYPQGYEIREAGHVQGLRSVSPHEVIREF